jgi:hypothetical protein
VVVSLQFATVVPETEVVMNYDTNDDPAEHDCAAIEERLSYERHLRKALEAKVREQAEALRSIETALDRWSRNEPEYWRKDLAEAMREAFNKALATQPAATPPHTPEQAALFELIAEEYEQPATPTGEAGAEGSSPVRQPQPEGGDGGK